MKYIIKGIVHPPKKELCHNLLTLVVQKSICNKLYQMLMSVWFFTQKWL